jgi:hypothetical protein
MKSKAASLTYIVTLVFLTACGANENQYVQLCKFAIKETLRSPSTFEAVKVEDYSNTNDPAVFIDYDAANAFGTLVRGKARCKFSKDESGISLASLNTGNGEVSETKLVIINYEWESNQR